MKVKLKLMGKIKIGWLAADVTGQDRSDPPSMYGEQQILLSVKTRSRMDFNNFQSIHGSSARSYVHHIEISALISRLDLSELKRTSDSR